MFYLILIARIVYVKRIIRKILLIYKLLFTREESMTRYVVIVSHGKLAEGLKNALSMLVGKRDDILAIGLEDGKTVDTFVDLFDKSIEKITTEDEVILLGDLIGGSPLTNATNVLTQKNIKTVVMGGMNLPLALTTVLMKDTLSFDAIATTVLSEAHSALQEFKLVVDDDDDI